MAGFIAKQIVGKKLDSVKDAFGDKDDGKRNDSEQDEAAIAEARREAEERRKDKHRKMEEDREKMRQDIRDKYGIKKKENELLPSPITEENRTRKKLSNYGLPEQTTSEDAHNSILPKNLTTEKCELQ